jgi:serine O-acetyltransferase
MNRKQYIFYVEADRIISGRQKMTFFATIKDIISPDYILRFMTLLRRVEYLSDKMDNISRFRSLVANYRFKNISTKLGFSIPPHVFGPGLYIPHYGTIVVNPNTKVGANCVLHTCTCIAGDLEKVIGDNVYISTGSVISGNVSIGHNITISANSFVNKSFNGKNMLIGGCPAIFLKNKPAWYISDGEKYMLRVKEIEELRKKLFELDA